MATFGIRVFKHHEKKDGTFNVKIRITQERRSAYIDTSHFVTAKMLSKNYEVKDTFILKELYGTLSDYREAVSRLGSKVNYMDADEGCPLWALQTLTINPDYRQGLTHRPDQRYFYVSADRISFACCQVSPSIPLTVYDL